MKLCDVKNYLSKSEVTTFGAKLAEIKEGDINNSNAFVVCIDSHSGDYAV